MTRGLRQAVSFLTPLGGARPPAPAALAWFPVVGATLGAVLGATWAATGRAWPAPVAAALVVAADLALTGLLHLDGVVDAADGLLPHLGAGRRLAVMAEPPVGAFGVVVAATVLLLRWAALATLVADVRVLAALWCLSRTAMAVVALTVPYARPGGLAAAFLPGGRPGAGTAACLGGGVAAAAALALWWRPLAGGAAVLAALAAAAGVVALARRRIGGFTGDVLGAVGVVSETAGLVVAAGRW